MSDPISRLTPILIPMRSQGSFDDRRLEGPFRVAAADVFQAGVQKAEGYQAGSQEADGYHAGMQQGEAYHG